MPSTALANSRSGAVLALGALSLLHCSDSGTGSPGGVAGSAGTTTGGSVARGGGGASTGGGASNPGGTGGSASAGSGVTNAGGGGASNLTGSGGSSTGGGGSGTGGAQAGSGGQSGGEGDGGGSGGSGTFAISSSEHMDGASFGDAFTCAGEGRSPALSWTTGPTGTKSYAITFLDETLVSAGNMNGYHYVIWDIPASSLMLPGNLPSGATLTTPVAAKQFSPENPFDSLPANTYFGPCPNAVGSTNNTDTYAFTIYALSVETLTGSLNGVRNIASAIQATTPLATAKLSGKSSAKPD